MSDATRIGWYASVEGEAQVLCLLQSLRWLEAVPGRNASLLRVANDLDGDACRVQPVHDNWSRELVTGRGRRFSVAHSMEGRCGLKKASRRQLSKGSGTHQSLARRPKTSLRTPQKSKWWLASKSSCGASPSIAVKAWPTVGRLRVCASWAQPGSWRGRPPPARHRQSACP